ncbi:hypothetical protein LPJ66_008861 [Kickxella alabastrina]|uniref:Uncharacterized protein n=1 Tax=Kickxella alabastrina TaxID=61397 RepID=A0ACC1I4X0_9FUNG|nr:hypothetical protein LPJ66_008861 [Kickxella alabastrina]
MQCSVCKTANPKHYYCGTCVHDRVYQHDWVLGTRHTVAERAHPGALQQQHHAHQSGRLQGLHQRITQLRAQISRRQQQISAAQRLHHQLASAQARRQTQLEEALAQGAGRAAERQVLGAQEACAKSLERCQRIERGLAGDRGTLARALSSVVGLQLDVPEDEVLVLLDDGRQLFGLPWPGPEEWTRYPAEYINACVGHCVHVFSVLAHYFHADLPFRVLKRGPRLMIRPHWRSVDAGEALLSLSGGAGSGVAAFVVGLGMLLFNVAYLCHCRGVSVPVEQVADAVENLRLAVVGEPEPEPEPEPGPGPAVARRQQGAFALDVYAVIMEAAKMYAGPMLGGDSEGALRTQVHGVLRSLHLCDDAVDSVDYDDENWAII